MTRRKSSNEDENSPKDDNKREKQIQRYIQESSDDHSSPWEIDESATDVLTMEDLLHLPIYKEGRNAAGSGDKAMFQVRISGSLMRALERGYERSRLTFGNSKKKPFDLWADYQRHALFTAALIMNMSFNEELGPEDIINLFEQEDIFVQETVPELLDRLKRSLSTRKEVDGKIIFGKFMSRVFNDTGKHIAAYMYGLQRDSYLKPWLDSWKKWQRSLAGDEVDDSVPEGDH